MHMGGGGGGGGGGVHSEQTGQMPKLARKCPVSVTDSDLTLYTYSEKGPKPVA